MLAFKWLRKSLWSRIFSFGQVLAIDFIKPELDERKRKILKAIVTDYVKTAEPVGSEFLAVRYRFDVKPATIRNEMARMSEMGYLRQPHTSAGRIPSDLGYRFYVDWLMSPRQLPNEEADTVRNGLRTADFDVEAVINQTCRILTSLTHHTAVATEPATDDTEIRYTALSLVAKRKLLLVVAFSNGCIEHRILESPEEIDQSTVTRLSNALSAEMNGKTVDSLTTTPVYDVPQEIIAHSKVYSLALSTVIQLARSLSEREVYLQGANYLLKQPEFKDLDKIEKLLTAFEERKLLFELLSKSLLGEDVAIIIGEENPLSLMRETSLVASKYKIGDRVAGTVAVIGPTRMDYRRAVTAVRFMAQNLSELLTAISVG
jgi:heat-inducible transcriptional repressor